MDQDIDVKVDVSEMTGEAAKISISGQTSRIVKPGETIRFNISAKFPTFSSDLFDIFGQKARKEGGPTKQTYMEALPDEKKEAEKEDVGTDEATKKEVPAGEVKRENSPLLPEDIRAARNKMASVPK